MRLKSVLCALQTEIQRTPLSPPRQISPLACGQHLPGPSSTPSPGTRGLPEPLPCRPPPHAQRWGSVRCPDHRRPSGRPPSKPTWMVCQPSGHSRGHPCWPGGGLLAEPWRTKGAVWLLFAPLEPGGNLARRGKKNPQPLEATGED